MISLYNFFESIELNKNYKIDNIKTINTNGLFIVQEHKADKAGLHYDLRIGKDNVLLSWATRKLPLTISSQQKIILFKQPDHDPSWYNFSGEIKDGYGKGIVRIWDKGKYDIVKWDIDHIILNFHGSKLNGNYVLIPYEHSDSQFLFFKKKH